MLPAGTIISDFRIEDLLGEGGMATVYEAHQVSLDRTVALKVLAARLGDDPDFQERFRRECQIQARLDHPHIVPIHAAGNSQYGLWLAMRLVRGPTLRELLLAEPLPPARALILLAPVAAALDVAHDSGLIHRDITPQNILIERNEHPFLSDFGITRGRGDRSLTQTGQFLGTLDYVAPEQIRDEPITTTADIYSFGAVLFECLAGRVPFEKKTDTALMWAHVHEEPPLVSQVNPSLPKALDPVLGKALTKLPGDRYARASDLIADATKALSPPPNRRPPPPEEEEGRSLRLVALISSLAVGLAALVFGAMSIGSADTTDTRRVVAGDLAVEIPRDWTVSKVRQSPIVGLPLEDPAVLSAGQGQTVTIGMSGATGKSLLPPGLPPPAAPDGEPVALGELEALRYSDLPTEGSSPGMGVFVVPKEGGVATVACRPGAQGPSFFDACQRIASTLELVEGRAYPLGPSPAFARALRRQLTILDRRRSKLTKRLDAAETADEQAAVASGLKAAFRRAARGLSFHITPQSAAGQASVVGGLRAVRSAYAELAAAATREDADGYANAARIVKRTEERLDRRLRSLERLGYRVVG